MDFMLTLSAEWMLISLSLGLGEHPSQKKNGISDSYISLDGLHMLSAHVNISIVSN